jgi:hypothetical protein
MLLLQATSGRYNSKDDFTVIGHNFLTEATIPNKRTPREDTTDFSFLSEDCFHFSQKAQAVGQLPCLFIRTFTAPLSFNWILGGVYRRFINSEPDGQ